MKRLETMPECIAALTTALELVSGVYIASAPISGRVALSPGAVDSLAKVRGMFNFVIQDLERMNPSPPKPSKTS